MDQSVAQLLLQKPPYRNIVSRGIDSDFWARRARSEPLPTTLATPSASNPSPGATPATTPFPASSGHEITDPEPTPPPPPPPISSSLPFPPNEQIVKLDFRSCHGRLPPIRTQLPHRRCSASGRLRRGRLTSSLPPLRTSRLQLTRRAVAGAPCRRPRPLRSAPQPVTEGWPAGQAQSRRHGAGGRGNSESGVRGADSLALDSQGPRHHPPLSGDGDGDGDCVLPAPHMQHHSRSQLSYKEVLLRQCESGCQGGRSMPLPAKIAQVRGLRVGEEGCQAVKIKHPWSSTAPQPDNEARRQEERRSLYLRKMKGLCFNCLARDHKVAACRELMRCWQCRRYGHISTDCPSRRSKPSPSSLENDSALKHTSTGACSFVDDSLLLFSHSLPSATCENSFDPMVIEAHLMMHMHDSGDTSSTVQAATPLLIANHLSCEERLKHNQPTVDIVRTPLIVRCQEEQLVGHELFKALSNLKHAAVTPLSHSIRRDTTPEKKSVVVHQESNMHSSQHRKPKTRTVKPGYKMVRNMLTKKWFVVRKESKDKQLIALAKFLEALRWPP